MSVIPAGVRAVFFDAVGTLIHPEPAAEVVYAAVGRSLGSRYGEAEVRERFWNAYCDEEQRDVRRHQATDEAREEERWRNIVAEALDDCPSPELCFRTLYAHFAGPGAWACADGAAEVIAALRGRGLFVGMASNFDTRLRGVVAGRPELAGVQALVISSEVGWKKPAAGFFAAVCREVKLPPEQVLMVGDDAVNDYLGARRAGLRAVLVTGARGEDQITDIRDLLT